MGDGKLGMVSKIAKKYNIDLIYIFGSQIHSALELLRGGDIETSDSMTDMDVGIVFNERLPRPKERYQLYGDVHNQLQDIFNPFPLDLIFLQETHSVFQARAICGRCIYFSSPSIKDEYEENILRRAADFRPFLERYLDELLEEVK